MNTYYLNSINNFDLSTTNSRSISIFTYTKTYISNFRVPILTRTPAVDSKGNTTYYDYKITVTRSNVGDENSTISEVFEGTGYGNVIYIEASSIAGYTNEFNTTTITVSVTNAYNFTNNLDIVGNVDNNNNLFASEIKSCNLSCEFNLGIEKIFSKQNIEKFWVFEWYSDNESSNEEDKYIYRIWHIDEKNEGYAYRWLADESSNEEDKYIYRIWHIDEKNEGYAYRWLADEDKTNLKKTNWYYCQNGVLVPVYPVFCSNNSVISLQTVFKKE